MDVMTNAVRGVIKLGLLAAAIMFAAVGLGQESQPASAAHTEVLLSYSSVSPIHVSALAVTPDGLPRDLYAWVVNADNATGVSGYHLEINFDSSSLTVIAFEAPEPLWLGSSGRSASCSANVVPDRAFMDCTSIGSGLGATGTGLLGKVTIDPGSEWQVSLLDLTGTFLLDTPPPPEFVFSDIPVTLRPTTVVFMHCADFSGDGEVDLFHDIIAVILQWGKTPASPDWNPIFDINKNGSIDLFGDIIGTIGQYGLPCNQPV